MRRSAVLGLSLLACVQALAADDVRVQIEQRLKLAARLIADPTLFQRLADGASAQAQSQLDQGRLQHALAEDALKRNDLPGARRAVDEALRHIGSARRMLPAAANPVPALQRRQQQMLATLERLVESLYGSAGPPEVRDGDVDAALGLMDTARAFGSVGRHDEALFTLGLAERHLLSALPRFGAGREVDYTPRAAGPQQAFALELQRHDGLAELLPLALRELRPTAATRELVERHGEAGRALREQARQQADGGDLSGALERIREASMYVQRALQAAGVATPQATGVLP